MPLQHKKTLGMMGKKLASTHRFIDGKLQEVTILDCQDMPVIQNKTKATDGYSAVQVAFGNKKQRTKAVIGHFAENKAVGALTEFRLDVDTEVDLVTMEVLADVETVKVIGKTKGKGFAGPVKRWGFRTQDATHGNSLSHRAHGSTGQCQFPGRVFKGKKMAGRMGHTQTTVKNIRIHKLDHENKLLYLQGSVPGAVGSYVKILPYFIKKEENK